MTEIERLARVARDQIWEETNLIEFERGGGDDASLAASASVVRAVLQAMREPSKHAIESGQLAAEEAVEFTQDSYETYPVFSLSPMAIRAWEAMIDHILAGGE